MSEASIWGPHNLGCNIPTPCRQTTIVKTSSEHRKPLYVQRNLFCIFLSCNVAMPESIINDTDLALDRYDGNIFVITMRKAPENRLNSAYAQKLIGAFNTVRKTLGSDSEGAVITKGNDTKFWCTVRPPYFRTALSNDGHLSTKA